MFKSKAPTITVGDVDEIEINEIERGLYNNLQDSIMGIFKNYFTIGF